jgi:hypothetical protein
MQSQTLTPDRTEIQKCWSLLPHPDGSIIRVFARNRVTGEMDGDFARNADEMYHFAERNVDKQVYVCPNPASKRAGTRHGAEDVTHWSFLLFDMDPIEDVYDAAPALDEALLWLGEWAGRNFFQRRPIIIDSGRGRQAWIRLDDILLGGDHAPGGGMDRKTARKTMGYWLTRVSDKVGLSHGCKLDTCTSDLPRPMRMPGTFNQKTHRMARIVDVGAGSFEGFASLLVTGTPDKVFIEPEVRPLAPGTPWQKVVSSLTLMAKDYLKTGREEPGRHKAMWHTARMLQERGIGRDEARKALRQANRLRGKSQELSAEEVEHALDTAFGG